MTSRIAGRTLQPVAGFVLFFLLAACNTQGPATRSTEETPPGTSATPKRTLDVGIVVVDMTRSLNFYRDLIGLPVVAEFRIGQVGEPVVSRIGDGEMVWLRYRESLIKLVEMDVEPSGRTPTSLSKATGFRFITLPVPDIEALMAKMEQAKAPLVVPLIELADGVKISMVEDPDGNVVEFIEPAPRGG